MGLFEVLLVAILTTSALSKMDFYIDENIEQCSKPGESAEAYDLSQFEFIASSDTEMIINGYLKFLKDIQTPWRVFAFTEKFDRGQWNLYAFQRKIDDFCVAIHSPTESWYQYTKDLKGCPLKPGDQWNFDSIKINTDLPFMIPPHYVGKWRLTIQIFLLVDGVEKKDCFRFSFEMMESKLLG